MKTEPTDIDRKAVRLFVPAPGMRVLGRDGWGRLSMAAWAGEVIIHCENDSLARRGDSKILAIDTDDHATVGAMLAQVRAMPGWSGAYAYPWSETPMPESRTIEWAVQCAAGLGRHFGPTEGAALVAARRALKTGKTKEQT